MEIRTKCPRDRVGLVAAAEGNLTTLQKEISGGFLNFSSVCTSGCTVLHWAAGCNQISVMEYLIFDQNWPVDTTAVKQSRGRTALHYACRNGCFEAVQWLVKVAGAYPDSPAKHGVTPFQMAVWQNQLRVAKWLVQECASPVNPHQLNDFGCGAVHWIGLSPRTRKEQPYLTRTTNNNNVIPMAEWLTELGLDWKCRQRQGHTPLHKAAWGGHLSLVKYLHQTQDLWDDQPDDAGNFAADLADMAHTPHHEPIAQYLRDQCSRARAESCAILQVPTTSTEAEIRKAYLQRAKEIHPDRKGFIEEQDQQLPLQTDELSSTSACFDALHKAYRHLIEDKGRGNQSNPSHSLNLMIQHVNAGAATSPSSHSRNRSVVSSEDVDNSTCFKARLIAVLLEFGDKGLDLSNLKKKWQQLWPTEPFPDYDASKKRALADLLQKRAGDVMELRRTRNKKTIRVVPKAHILEGSKRNSS